MHLPTCSSPTPSTVLLYHICYVERPSAAVILVSSSQYCSLADVLLSTKSDRTTVLPFCTPSSQLHTSRERQQQLTLVQPSNRLSCDKVPYTYAFLSLEQANTISETADDPYHTDVQTSTRYLGNIASFQLRVIPVPEDKCWCSHLSLLAQILTATHNSVSMTPSSSP